MPPFRKKVTWGYFSVSAVRNCCSPLDATHSPSVLTMSSAGTSPASARRAVRILHHPEEPPTSAARRPRSRRTPGRRAPRESAAPGRRGSWRRTARRRPAPRHSRRSPSASRTHRSRRAHRPPRSRLGRRRRPWPSPRSIAATAAPPGPSACRGPSRRSARDRRDPRALRQRRLQLGDLPRGARGGTSRPSRKAWIATGTPAAAITPAPQRCAAGAHAPRRARRARRHAPCPRSPSPRRRRRRASALAAKLPSATALSMLGRSIHTTRPAPMLVCPTSELPICPSGSPTSGPCAASRACGQRQPIRSKFGVSASATAFASRAGLAPSRPECTERPAASLTSPPRAAVLSRHWSIGKCGTGSPPFAFCARRADKSQFYPPKI